MTVLSHCHVIFSSVSHAVEAKKDTSASKDVFFRPSNLTSHSFIASSVKRIYGISSESPDQGPIDFCIVESLAVHLEYAF